MAKKSFNFGNTKKRAQKDQEQRSGGSLARMKLSAGTTRLMVLPPYNEAGDMWKRVMVHQVWKARKPIATATCARTVEGEECPVCKFGFKLKDKFQDNKSEKKQNAYRLFMPTNDVHINALDLKEVDGEDVKVKVLRIPSDAYELLLNEVDESKDGKDIFDFDIGRAMRIKGNGKDGRDRRYSVVKFERAELQLLADGKLTEEQADEILKSLFNLDKLEPAYSEKKLSLVLNKLKAQAENVVGKVSSDDDEDSSVDDDEVDESDEDDDLADDDDGDDDDLADDDDESDEADEADDDDDDDLADDDESDDDDDLADEDESDEDDDLSDDDDDDEDEKPVKKKSSQTKRAGAKSNSNAKANKSKGKVGTKAKTSTKKSGLKNRREARA